tara:strand:+ start:112 stop:612 length:501 start_codon:yes stop_codon:yes gene_type:complete
MKIVYFLCIFILIGCANQKTVFWCGDHECLNKKERKTYFQKEMTVQVKVLSESDIKEKSDIEKITQQFFLTENEVKKRDKIIRKQAKIEEKKRKREGKRIKKQILLEKKKKKIEEKRSKKQTVLIKKSSNEMIKNDNYLSAFDKIKERILSKNISKPYPDINDIPK